MRITELLEGTIFNDLDFVTHKQDSREINFDLVDDLVHFMNHDDNVYRRIVYPTVARFDDLKKTNQDVKPSIFKPTAEKIYKIYIQKFPIRELPDELDEETCKKICDKMYEEVTLQLTDKQHKD
jgi:hypothetical protein